jgi:hypothetical protein
MDDALQAQLRAACSASVFVWLNLFGWTFRPKIVNPDGTERSTKGAEAHYPFITWKIQDEGLTAILEAIETGTDLGFDKSRDMGASWIILSALHWLWQFRPAFSAMELSRSEEYVDQKGNMKTLFEKHRYLLKWQPAWLRPRRIEDYYMRLVNHDNGSIIWGESANQNAGRGGRGNVALLDEFGAVENGEAQDRATADAFPCRIVNSTPQVGSYYNQWIDSGRLRVMKMPWWRHPEKGKGAHQVFDERGRPKWVSPWYFAQAKRRDKKHMAQEVDMEHGLAGATFFDHDELNRHREAHVREPMTTGSLVALGDYGPERVRGIIRNRDHKSFKFVEGGGWRFWIPLVNGRPPQHLSYCFGVDISNGANGSNSVITAYARETNRSSRSFGARRSSPNSLPSKLRRPAFGSAACTPRPSSSSRTTALVARSVASSCASSATRRSTTSAPRTRSRRPLPRAGVGTRTTIASKSCSRATAKRWRRIRSSITAPSRSRKRATTSTTKTRSSSPASSRSRRAAVKRCTATM